MTNHVGSPRLIKARRVIVAAIVAGIAMSFSGYGSSEGAQLIIDRSPRERYLAAESHEELKVARAAYAVDLRQRHGDPGDIHGHGDPKRGHLFARRADQIMREWNPIGFTADEVKAVLGPPRKEDDMMMDYWFLVGTSVAMWEFGLDSRGQVVSLKRTMGI